MKISSIQLSSATCQNANKVDSVIQSEIGYECFLIITVCRTMFRIRTSVRAHGCVWPVIICDRHGMAVLGHILRFDKLNRNHQITRKSLQYFNLKVIHLIFSFTSPCAAPTTANTSESYYAM